MRVFWRIFVLSHMRKICILKSRNGCSRCATKSSASMSHGLVSDAQNMRIYWICDGRCSHMKTIERRRRAQSWGNRKIFPVAMPTCYARYTIVDTRIIHEVLHALQTKQRNRSVLRAVQLMFRFILISNCPCAGLDHGYTRQAFNTSRICFLQELRMQQKIVLRRGRGCTFPWHEEHVRKLVLSP